MPNQVTSASVQDAATNGSPKADTVRPFHINVPEEALIDLRRRIAATRFPDPETVTDRSQGRNWRTSRSSCAIGAPTTTGGRWRRS